MRTEDITGQSIVGLRYLVHIAIENRPKHFLTGQRFRHRYKQAVFEPNVFEWVQYGVLFPLIRGAMLGGKKIQNSGKGLHNLMLTNTKT